VFGRAFDARFVFSGLSADEKTPPAQQERSHQTEERRDIFSGKYLKNL